MAPADQLSPAGSSSYASDTLNVGDGTWDFTKNTFLLPNLVGLNFDTMQYNGMGNRFSTITEYHSLVTAHGVLAAIVFLFIVPAAVMIARFYAGRGGYAIRYHAYLQVLAVGLITVVFILGWFAVGPNRSLTNPHHGIGVAIYVLILLQAIGGRLIKHITKMVSFRRTIHQWSGRAIAILGIVQVPLGLTLYGSPKFTFILYTLWMTFLVLVYFILDYRHSRHRERYVHDDRYEEHSRVTERKSSGGGMKWLGPLAAGAGAFAFLRGRNRNRSRSRSRAHSRSRSRSRAPDHSRSRVASRSRSRPPEVIPSRRGSVYEEEKYSNQRRSSGGGGFMGKLATAGAAVGAGGLLASFMGRRRERDQRRQQRDEEYSAVATDTPSRRSRLHRSHRHRPTDSEYSAETEEMHHHRDGRRTPLLPGPGNPTLAAAALSAAESRHGAHGGPRPVTPRPSHQRTHSHGAGAGTMEPSDYSSYTSPSRRTPAKSGGGGGVGKGILAGLGLGWFAKKMKDRRGQDQRRDDDDDESYRSEEHDRRHRRGGGGDRGSSRYTGDGYPSPSRRPSRHRVHRPPPGRGTTMSASEVSSSVIETRPLASTYSGPPMPPLTAPGGAAAAAAAAGGGGPPPVPVPVPVPASPLGGPSRSHSVSRHDVAIDPAVMPPMPPDPKGILHQLGPESGSETYNSSGGRMHRRHSSRRRREGEAAAAVAAAAASRLAAEEAGHHHQRRGERSRDHTPPAAQPMSIKVKVHDDRDRNVTLRRLTEEEAAAARQAGGGPSSSSRRRRNDSVSSLSGAETPISRRRYRRDSSLRRAEQEAERRAEEDDVPLAPGPPPPVPPQFQPPQPPLSPPNPAFAGGKRPKDSAYYSGQPGPSGVNPAAGHTVSSIGSPDSHGTWSGLSPSPSGAVHDPTASAAERRRRRRLERRDTRPGGAGVGTVDFT